MTFVAGDTRATPSNQKAASVDASLQNAYDHLGDDGVQYALENDNAVEIALNAIAVDWDAHLRGDAEAASSLLTVKPAGMSNLPPPWALDAGRARSKAV